MFILRDLLYRMSSVRAVNHPGGFNMSCHHADLRSSTLMFWWQRIYVFFFFPLPDFKLCKHQWMHTSWFWTDTFENFSKERICEGVASERDSILKQTVSSLKRKNHGFGVEETAACWETCFQIPVRRLLPGTHGGMHKEMVSCHCLHVSRVPLLISSPACACVSGMLSWPVTYLTNGNDLSIPRAFLCVGRGNLQL